MNTVDGITKSEATTNDTQAAQKSEHGSLSPDLIYLSSSTRDRFMSGLIDIPRSNPEEKPNSLPENQVFENHIFNPFYVDRFDKVAKDQQVDGFLDSREPLPVQVKALIINYCRLYGDQVFRSKTVKAAEKFVLGVMKEAGQLLKSLSREELRDFYYSFPLIAMRNERGVPEVYSLKPAESNVDFVIMKLAELINAGFSESIITLESDNKENAVNISLPADSQMQRNYLDTWLASIHYETSSRAWEAERKLLRIIKLVRQVLIGVSTPIESLGQAMKNFAENYATVQAEKQQEVDSLVGNVMQNVDNYLDKFPNNRVSDGLRKLIDAVEKFLTSNNPMDSQSELVKNLADVLGYAENPEIAHLAANKINDILHQRIKSGQFTTQSTESTNIQTTAPVVSRRSAMVYPVKPGRETRTHRLKSVV